MCDFGMNTESYQAKAEQFWFQVESIVTMLQLAWSLSPWK